MIQDITANAEGGCTCGAVRYRLNARPMFVHCCHCTWCQRETGSAFVINALIEADAVDVPRGNPERFTVPSASGNGQHLWCCAKCRTTLWSHYGGAGAAVNFVRVGTLDDPSFAPPDVHIYTSTKQSWVVLPAGTPVCGEYYRRSELWPVESVERYKAAKARMAG